MKIILWKKYTKQLKHWADKLLNCLVACGMALILWMLLQVTSFASFRIPTDSMQPTLVSGDYILVEKWTMGARIFDLLDAAEGKEVKIHRLPGWGKVERNDVLVFNFPHHHRWDSIGMDLMVYYVKRCIALPGDTMGIRKGHYYIKGIEEPIGDVEAQERIARLDKEDARDIVMDAYPWDKYINWTIQDFGPLYVPAAGRTVAMDSTAVKLYRNLIEWEQKKPLSWNADKVYLGDSLIREYRFRENYYFVGGDNMENSKDSRYWGLLPEPYVVGVATRVWKSVDRATNKVRWDRMMKKIE